MTTTAPTVTGPANASPRDPGRSPRWIRGIYVANLVVQAGIILTGAIVRITGSGLGCPTWPKCVDGSLVPTSGQMESWHKYVEFGNRLLTFVLAIAAIAAVVGALVDRRRRRRLALPGRRVLTILAVVPLVGTAVQAVLGGITVLTGLNPFTVSAHFIVSIGLVAACVALVVRSGEPGDAPITWLVPSALRYLTWALVAATLAVVVLGVITTGSGPANPTNPLRRNRYRHRKVRTARAAPIPLHATRTTTLTAPALPAFVARSTIAPVGSQARTAP